jgi:hypothetical protein
MRRFTTDTDVITVADADLTGADVYVTYAQGTRSLTITDPVVAYSAPDSTVTVSLTQEQTGSFSTGKCNRQVNWVTQTERHATEAVEVPVTQNLLAEVKDFAG